MPDNEIDLIRYKRALGCFATGVAVATALDGHGRRVGITVSSFNSVSMDPPLVLWSISNDSRNHDVFVGADHFGVNVLAMNQESVATRFSQRNEDRFEGMDCRKGIEGIPMLSDYAACFECQTEHIYEGGDHKIIVGRVLRFDDRESDPLIFYRSRYMRESDRHPDEI